MPWKETRTVDERVRFIAAVQEDPRGNFARLCGRFGISRAKGYKWLQRYREFGPQGLNDRKSVPGTCPHRTPAAIEDRVVDQHQTRAPTNSAASAGNWRDGRQTAARTRCWFRV